MAERVACGLVQYIALRGDLLRVEKWPIGAIVAQACHASAAVLHQFREDPNTQLYFKNLDNMRKVVVEAKDEAELVGIADALQDDKMDFKLWTEQPENIATCLATKPYEKSDIQKYFKKLKLFK
ncbi:putative peptidyl-tRNA hydrolase PTRHD1 [Dysidea avara]|uniref:putative peptidyl-tRNA hydrolase PTRHD1 n=1 Tax=Dysidea avara TaxID=196820 RepID=UPI0033287F53